MRIWALLRSWRPSHVSARNEWLGVNFRHRWCFAGCRGIIVHNGPSGTVLRAWGGNSHAQWRRTSNPLVDKRVCLISRILSSRQGACTIEARGSCSPQAQALVTIHHRPRFITAPPRYKADMNPAPRFPFFVDPGQASRKRRVPHPPPRLSPIFVHVFNHYISLSSSTVSSTPPSCLSATPPPIILPPPLLVSRTWDTANATTADMPSPP